MLKTKDEKLASFLIIRACKYLNFRKLHRRHLSLMKLSKLNMSLENNSAEEEKEVSCHDVCATRHSPFPSYDFVENSFH